MNAHQRRAARRADAPFVTIRKHAAERVAAYWAERAGRELIELLGPAPRGVFLSVGSNDWRQS